LYCGVCDVFVVFDFLDRVAIRHLFEYFVLTLNQYFRCAADVLERRHSRGNTRTKAVIDDRISSWKKKFYEREFCVDAVFVLEKVHLKRQFHFLQLCTSVRRKTAVELSFTLLCSVVVDVERYWTVIDIACVKVA